MDERPVINDNEWKTHKLGYAARLRGDDTVSYWAIITPEGDTYKYGFMLYLHDYDVNQVTYKAQANILNEAKKGIEKLIQEEEPKLIQMEQEGNAPWFPESH